MRVSSANLKKLEKLMKALGFQVRYGRGNFQSGFCLLDEQNMLVINQFFDTQARMQALLDCLKTQPLDNLAALPADQHTTAKRLTTFFEQKGELTA